MLPSHRLARRVAGFAIGLALGVTAVGCSGSDTAVPTTTTSVPPPTTDPWPSDGELSIVAVLPESGPGASFGVPLAESVRRAVQLVNENGGVLGNPVRLRIVDEGADAATAAAALDPLLADGTVDAVVGPASSRIALAVLGQIVGAGVLACSPTATAINLAKFPDQGLFFRTIPSDALQAEAMARVVDQTGFGSVAIAFPNDLYGRTYGEALRASLGSLGITVLAEVAYDPVNDDQSEAVETILATNPPVVALVGDATVGVRTLVQLLDAADDPLPFVVVNDPMRRPAQPSEFAVLRSAQLARIKGVAPEVLPQSTALLEQLGLGSGDLKAAFAAQAFDCVNLIALGAFQAGTDDPQAIAGQLASVSRGGTSCRDFASCVSLLNEGRNIDYNGYEGIIRLDAAGDAAVGRFVRFAFDDDFNAVVEARFEVGVTP
jgi:branched-chain amino acid transport system substrate-binding protein